ncbi:MAG: stage II sporulation protein P [Oscillospiraceae bacterium]|jgi:stage II sporulation protein P|nr:stage II sporulation protein P [Oscillospiraceae bacterium]
MQEFRSKAQAEIYLETQERERRTTMPNNPSSNRKRGRLLAVACVAVAAFTLLASDGLLHGAALLGAGMQFPAGVGVLLPAANAAQPDGMQTIAVTNAASPPKIPEAETAAKDFDITATPADIRVLMEEAVREYAGDKKAGAITERTYTAKDGTQSFGNVSIRNTTATYKNVNIEAELKKRMPLKIDKSKPAVLIYHTHTTEAYEILDRGWYPVGWQERSENKNKNVVRVGDAIAQMLERAGYQVIHDTTVYDRQYGGAYDRSRLTMQKYLKEYPNIMVTVDVHRDAIHPDDGSHIKPVATVNGKKAAQIMIITGIEEGAIVDYPDWRQNLTFALQLHKAAEDLAPGLMRPLFFCPRKYNMNETPYSLLLEFGSDGNTLEEAVYSGRLIGAAMAKWMDGHVTA